MMGEGEKRVGVDRKTKKNSVFKENGSIRVG